MAKKNCSVCGQTGYMFYPFCLKHLEDKKTGAVIKCDNCDNWFIKAKGCDCLAPQKTAGKCVKCGKPCNDKYEFCYDCYIHKTQSQITQETKTAEQTPKQKGVCSKCGKKCGDNFDICYTCKFGDSASKSGQQESSNSYTRKAIIKEIGPENADIRKQWEAMHRCNDGHYVRSYSEALIDNWLYENDCVHAYEKKVFLKKNPDKTLISDFYIHTGRKGVYIEFFGLDDGKYQARKEEKIALYKNNNINLIVLEPDDIKILDDILPQKLHEFGIWDE